MSSQSEADSLLESHVIGIYAELEKHGVDPTHLAVIVLLGELAIGEVMGLGVGDPLHDYLATSAVRMKNPKRLRRLTLQNQQTGALSHELSFSDFDMLNEGEVVFRPQGGFFLRHTDFQTQLNYARAYMQFLEGRIRARAQQAGLEVPDPQHPLSPILPPGANFKR